MWSLGADPALLIMIGVLIGLAVFIGTLLSIWANRSYGEVRQATKLGLGAAVPAGGAGLGQAVYFGGNRVDSAESIVLLAIYAFFAFTVAYHVSLRWARRHSNHRRGV